MIDLFLSYNNREEVLLLPIFPMDFRIVTSNKNEVFSSIKLGDIQLIGLKGLTSVTFSSYFPSREYPFLRRERSPSKTNTLLGWDYVKRIERWRDKKAPIRLAISDTPINMACTIDSFEYGLEDSTKDVYFSMSLSEFKFIKLQEVKK